MQTETDAQLLRRYVEQSAENAFAELIRRRIGFVHAAALRQVGRDAHRAEDVTQEVFVALARRARSLQRHPALLGWLHTTTRYAAHNLQRSERRRQAREQEAAAMHDAAKPEADWTRLRPMIDDALHELNERDRESVLLRFFDQQSFAAIGRQLGLSENAAQKRIDRALDRLQAALTRRGVTSTGAALGIALASEAATAAPAGLAATIHATACASAATAGPIAAATGFLAVMSANKLALGVGAAVAITAIVALNVAVNDRRAARDATAQTAAADDARELQSGTLPATEEQSAHAETRVIEADQGSAVLAREATERRARQAPTTVASSAPAPSEDDERRALQRTYQQDLARRRAAAARFETHFQADIAALPAQEKFSRCLDAAAQFAANAEFQDGIKLYNRAMQLKPADTPVTAEMEALHETLLAQRDPVNVAFHSDGLTWVMIAGVRMLERFTATTADIPPGNYVIIGQRAGFEDVRLPLEVRNGAPPVVVSVMCNTPKK